MYIDANTLLYRQNGKETSEYEIHPSLRSSPRKTCQRLFHAGRSGYILNEIKAVITAESPDAVLIAGDVYDKPVPPAEAVRLFDDFLVQLSRWGLKVFVISGNHDSPERIAFGSRLMDASGIYLSPVYDGTVTPVSLHDTYGVVDIYMLPFLKPAHVRRFYETETEQIQSYTDAMQTAISHLPLDHTRRNVLITHQL